LTAKQEQPLNWRSTMPLVWELVSPRRSRMLAGLGLLLVSRAAGLVVPYAPKFVLDVIITKSQFRLIWPLFAVLAFSVVLQAATSYALSQLLSIEGQRLITEMRRRVQAHICRLPIAFFDANKTGMLVSRVMTDVSGLRNLVGQGLVELLGGIITAVLVVIVLFHMSPLLTLVTLAFLTALSGFLTWSFLAIRPLFRESGKIAAEVSGRLVETFSGVRVVKGYRAESREEEVFAEGTERLLENANKIITLGSVMGSLAVLDVRLLSAAVLCIGADQVITHQMTAGTLFSYLMYLGYVIAPITQMARVGTQWTEALAGLDRTREVLAERSEDQDENRTISLPAVTGHIEFHDVSFEYETGKQVLDRVTFDARTGTVTALVGSSGSGKSTIIGLIAAFYKPTSGTILVDGKDLSQVRLDGYRPALGIVLQESFLFDGTIRDNVAFSRNGATQEEVTRACRIAHVDEFAERFRDKYETVIGERGIKLSGGQRQRVSIARAILADPRILILDEATSSLDSESEAFIQDGLRYLMAGRTTFVIAHRLSTARQADEILVIERGRVLECGNHDSLYLQRGRYFDLYSRQHSAESNVFQGSDGSVEDTRKGTSASGLRTLEPEDSDQRALEELL
jgi:subfamily B ATP-binding cassette protein MsbA